MVSCLSGWKAKSPSVLVVRGESISVVIIIDLFSMGDAICFSRKSDPLGTTWEDWVQRWWIWCLKRGEEMSPAADKSGKYCQQDQLHPHVWFLAGTFGEKAIRSCRVPMWKSLFFPVINDLISFFEYPMFNKETELLEYSRRDLDTTSLLSVTVDGNPMKGLNEFRVRSKLFDIGVPFTEPYCQSYTKAVTDGYWVFLKPLSRGQHKIHIRGAKLAYDEVALHRVLTNKRFTTDVEYHLDIA